MTNYKQEIDLINAKIRLLELQKKANTKHTSKPEVVINDNSEYKNFVGTPKERAIFYWTQSPKTVENSKGKPIPVGGWKLLRNGLKVEKSWTTADGKSNTKEFDAIELEKDGQVITPLLVKGIYKIWN
jgi:hypothetical protein